MTEIYDSYTQSLRAEFRDNGEGRYGYFLTARNGDTRVDLQFVDGSACGRLDTMMRDLLNVPRYWSVSAQVNGRQLPTFMLNPNVQGITDVDHARGVALDIITGYLRAFDQDVDASEITIDVVQL